ncbi:hypothetical protein, partial [Bacteroides xylanisolvens]|uniref:hypothetical protein n=1 Tax=Bacteroides xylanisolvens TaxID=371601 RepID=UPI001E53FCEC
QRNGDCEVLHQKTHDDVSFTTEDTEDTGRTLIFYINPQSLHRMCCISAVATYRTGSHNYKTATTMRIRPLCPLRPLW